MKINQVETMYNLYRYIFLSRNTKPFLSLLSKFNFHPQASNSASYQCPIEAQTSCYFRYSNLLRHLHYQTVAAGRRFCTRARAPLYTRRENDGQKSGISYRCPRVPHASTSSRYHLIANRQPNYHDYRASAPRVT